ncbi:MAG: hypothetical protein COB15_14055 [Flavobacteriales bacterium]|nr:MAG: hypothetical protein COB15_14055 [Flavobacteriales bacterium]
MAKKEVSLAKVQREIVGAPYAHTQITYKSPPLEDAISEYAYFLLLKDIVKIQHELKRGPFSVGYEITRQFLNFIKEALFLK